MSSGCLTGCFCEKTIENYEQSKTKSNQNTIIIISQYIYAMNLNIIVGARFVF